MPRLIAPDGAEIVGTVETIPGVALIGNVTRTAKGFTFEYDGETEIDWDGQMTERSDTGLTLYEDENGKQWTEDQIKVADDEEEGDDE